MKSRLTPKTDKPTSKKTDSRAQTEAAKRPRVRTFTNEEKKELVERAIENVRNGISISSLCEDTGISFSTIYAWCAEVNCDGISALTHAREVGTEALADRLLDELKTATNDNIVIVKTRVDSILRLVGKWNPKAYGDKQTVDVNHAMPDFQAMPSELRAEIRRYLQAAGSGSLPSLPVTIVQEPEG